MIMSARYKAYIYLCIEHLKEICESWENEFNSEEDARAWLDDVMESTDMRDVIDNLRDDQTLYHGVIDRQLNYEYWKECCEKDSVAEWMNQRLIIDPQCKFFTGNANSNNTYGYSNYLQYSEETGIDRSYRVKLNIFSKRLGHYWNFLNIIFPELGLLPWTKKALLPSGEKNKYRQGARVLGDVKNELKQVEKEVDKKTIEELIEEILGLEKN